MASKDVKEAAKHIIALKKAGYNTNSLRIESVEDEDETKGAVGNGDSEDEEPNTDGEVVERAHTGGGYEYYKDFSKIDRNKFPNLVRD